MSDLDRFNQHHGIQHYGIANQLRFIRGQGGMPVAELNSALGQATISLQGAHLLAFQSHNQQPLLWLSTDATYAAGRAIRGGIPVCWPWFGAHASDSGLPSHGPARTNSWQPVASDTTSDGRTQLTLELIRSDAVSRLSPHPLTLQLHMTVGEQLEMTLETTNNGATPFVLGEALHTYFLVGDIRQTEVEGLDGCDYIDKLDEDKRKQQHGNIHIDAEVDRIYVGTSDRCCTIIDPVMQRKIIIQSQGSGSTVVWNPWIDKSAAMGDMGPDGYLNMLCVETSNAADDLISLPAGASHRLSVEYRII